MKPVQVIIYLILLLSAGCSKPMARHDKALEELDRLIEQRTVFSDMKNRRIADKYSEFRSAADQRTQIEILGDIYKEYHNFNIDSAYYYARKMLTQAMEYGDQSLINKARIYLARTFSHSGIYDEAVRLLRQVDTTNRSQVNMYDYYTAFWSIMMNRTHEMDSVSRIPYVDSVHYYNLLRIANLPADHIRYKILRASEYNDSGQPEKGLALLKSEFDAGIEGVHERAIAAYTLSLIYNTLGDSRRKKKFLISAVTDDLRTPVREGLALYDLSIMLFDEGDVIRANNYINCSLEDAHFCNFRTRINRSSQMVQKINRAYIESINSKRQTIGHVTVIVSVLVIILLCSLYVSLRYYMKIKDISQRRLEMNRQLQKLNNDIEQQNEKILIINRELREANDIKDEYVGHYLNLCSQYIQNLSIYRKQLLKLYKRDGVAALLNELRSRNPAEVEYKKFLIAFDETFLKLFPDFVSLVNEHIVVDSRFTLNNPQTLNTELRILALIRLGVSKSTEIASILNCSLATIHTYRAKLRNSALGDRREFDNDIRSIDFHGSK